MNAADDGEVIGVGDVRMVRTFRVGADGGLYPVNTAAVWTGGWNTATCGRGKTHTPPDPDCRCGFYVFSHPAYALSQAPAHQVMAIVAVHGQMEAGSRGARVQKAKIEAVWLGPRVSEELTAKVRRRYPSVRVLRDREAMFTGFPLTPVEGFKPPRVSEAGRHRIRVALWIFSATVALVGVLPTSVTLATPARAVPVLILLAAAAAITISGLAIRSSMVTFTGITSLAWLVTADSMTTTGVIIYRALLMLVTGWIGLIWWRAARPGRVIHDARLDTALRRWRSQLTSFRQRR